MAPDPASPAQIDGQRWSSHQPNVPGRGIVAGYSARFWCLVVILGLVTGAGASGLIALLRLVEHLAYGYHNGPFLDGVAVSPGWRRLVALAIAVVVVALGILVLGRLTVRRRGSGTDVSDALWLRGARLDLIPSIARAVLSIITVGLGVSLGREGAPQTFGAAVASTLSDRNRLPVWQRRLLVASGAGAGFAAVYNVPLGGSLFALEVLLGSLALPLVLPALATSVIATAVAWTTLGTKPTYDLPHYGLHPAQMVWALLAGPIIGLVGVGWVRLIRIVGELRPQRGWIRFAAPAVAFMALALVSLQYPQLLGNGKGLVQLGALGRLSLGLMVVLLVLKPLATAACLGSGSPGGLFTPTLTIGVLLAGILGSLWGHIWPGSTLGSYAVIGGGAFLAAAMQGPLSGVVLVLELTRNFDSLMAPTLLAVTEATVIARRLGAPSIYSARLRPDPDELSIRSAGAAAIDSLDRDPVLDDPDPEPLGPRGDPGPPGPKAERVPDPPQNEPPHNDERRPQP